MVQIAKELVGHPDRQLLEGYANGVGGPEVLEEIRARHQGDDRWDAPIGEAEKARAETEAVWDSVEELHLAAKEGVEKNFSPTPLQRDTRQPKAGGFAPRIGGKVEAKAKATQSEKVIPIRSGLDRLFGEPKAEPAISAHAKRLLGEPQGWPEAPKAPPDAEGFERLCYPPGLLGHCVQYVIDTAALPDRVIALATALSACAKGLDRKVLGPTGAGTVLFNLVIAETGAGKQHGISCCRTLLRAMGLEKVIAASGLASVQAIEEIIEGHGDKFETNPNVLVVIDEVGAWLSRISSKGQTGNVSEIPSHLQTLWGWPLEAGWTGTKKVGKEMKQVYGVAFSMLGFSTERAFFGALKKKEVASGFINRMLLWNVGRGWIGEQQDPKYHWMQCPKWLAEALKGVASRWPEPPAVIPPLAKPEQIGWGVGAKERWKEFDVSIRQLPSGEERELWIRAPEIAIRLATIVAVYRGLPVVEIADLEWGIEIAKASTRQLKRGLDEHLIEEMEQADLVKHIRQEFKRKEVLTQGSIRKLCERLTSDYRKIDWATDHLETCGEIIQFEQPIGPGRPTKKWRWHGA